MEHLSRGLTASLFFSVILFNTQVNAADGQQQVSIASKSQVENCEFKGQVTANSGRLKHADWRRHASHKALLRAGEMGATHVVVESLESVGTFHGKAKALAFDCGGSQRHS